MDLVGIHTVDGTVAEGQFRDQATFVDLAATVAQVAKVNAIATGETVVDASRVVVVVDAGGIGAGPIVEVVWIGRHIAGRLREMRQVR